MQGYFFQLSSSNISENMKIVPKLYILKKFQNFGYL